MNNLRISYLNSKLSRSNSSLTAISVVSPYSRNTPNIQLKSDLKKQSSSVERPKSGKMSYSGATTRGHTPINRDVTDRKHSPHAERKSDLLLSSLYQLAKQKPKEKSGSAKIYKTKDVQVKKTPKASSRPEEKMPDKSAIYQYLQNKGSRKLEDSKVLNPSSMMNTPSRQASRSHLHDGEFNFEKKMIEGRLFKQQQLIEALEEMHRMKNKSSISHSSSNGGPYMKSNQRSSQIKTGRTTPVSSQQLNVASILEKKKTMEPKKNELFKDLKLENDHYYVQKEKATPQTHNQPQPIMVLEGELMPKRHKRGLSTGQNPLCIDPFLLEQQRDREIQMEMEREREREKEREQEMIKQQQLQMQMQMQMEQQYKDPQQQEDEFFEEFFHMDKMTFDFEKLMISRKNEQQQLKQKQLQAQFFTPAASPLQKKPLMHSRTKSIEEVNSVLPTKSSSRWTTKRSSKGDEFPQHGREHFNLIEHISDFDKTENDREDIRRYYKGY